jgi:1,4-alpha-glucan branching enzyme
MAANSMTAGRSSSGNKQITFTMDAPQARSVSVAGSFCEWKTDCHPMHKDRNGDWSVTLPLPFGNYQYRFLVDGEWHDDPKCTSRAPNPFGTENCVLSVSEKCHGARES